MSNKLWIENVVMNDAIHCDIYTDENICLQSDYVVCITKD